MPRKPKPEPDDPAQSKRFVKAAKDRESDASGQQFARALDAIFSPPRNPKKKARKHQG